jgi:hypothetical protein
VGEMLSKTWLEKTKERVNWEKLYVDGSVKIKRILGK